MPWTASLRARCAQSGGRPTVAVEGIRAGPNVSPGSRFTVHRERLASLDRPLAKTEEAVLELATAGFTVRRILDVIPEDDLQIHGAITSLLERGLLSEV